ncbi:hypothetical protein ABZ721_31910 [Streptomyces sp. NPDC006733]|uniref:hypothetical protein n=1 Tax=Streptomyces sp. NPDC006733 TaxID=3155460 RepID=UPI0033E53FA1
MTTRRIRLVATAGMAALGIALTALSAAPASAASKYSECSTNGGILSIGTEYDMATQNTVYVKDASFTIERNGNKHNNVYLRVRQSNGSDIWAWTSEDDVVGGRTVTQDVKKRISRTLKPYLKGNATFDKSNASDPNCSAYITYPTS